MAQTRGWVAKAKTGLVSNKFLIRKHVVLGYALFLPCLNSSQMRSLDGGGFLLRGFWTQNPLYSFLVARDVPGAQGGF